MVREVAKEFIYLPMVEKKLVNIKMANQTDMQSHILQMAPSIRKASSKMMNFFMPKLRHYLIAHHQDILIIVSVLIPGTMEQNTQGNGRIINHMAKELKLGPMETNMQGNGKMTKELAKELILGPMETNMQGNGKMTIELAKELILGVMVNGLEINTLGNLKMARDMAVELIHTPMVEKKLVHLKITH